MVIFQRETEIFKGDFQIIEENLATKGKESLVWLSGAERTRQWRTRIGPRAQSRVRFYYYFFCDLLPLIFGKVF